MDINNASQEIDPQTSSPEGNHVQLNPPKRSNKRIFIISGIILILLLGAGVYVLGNKIQKNPVTTQPQQGTINKQIPNISTAPSGNNNTSCNNQNQSKVTYAKAGDIWIVNIDGTCAEQLTHYGANFNPELSPKGNYIIYYSLDEKVKDKVLSQQGEYDNTGSNIWSIKIDGANATKLTESNITAHRRALGWSPLGNQVLYLEDGKVLVVNPDGTGKRLIIDLNTIQDIAVSSVYPFWSPDGSQVAVTAFTKADLAGLGEGSPSFTQILLFDLNGKLLNRYINPLRLLSYWSPINNKLYFIDGTNGIGAYGLESVNLDGTNKTLISGESPNNLSSHANPPSTKVTDSAIYGADESIEVSQDGKMIATIRDEWYHESKTDSPLWIMNIDGSNSHPVNLPSQLTDQLKSSQLTTNNGSDTTSLRAIKWMPDSQHLILQVFTTGFGAAGGGHPDRSSLYSIKIDGTDLKILDSLHPVTLKAPYIIRDDEFSTGVESLY